MVEELALERFEGLDPLLPALPAPLGHPLLEGVEVLLLLADEEDVHQLLVEAGGLTPYPVEGPLDFVPLGDGPPVARGVPPPTLEKGPTLPVRLLDAVHPHPLPPQDSAAGRGRPVSRLHPPVSSNMILLLIIEISLHFEYDKTMA